MAWRHLADVRAHAHREDSFEKIGEPRFKWWLFFLAVSAKEINKWHSQEIDTVI